MEFGAPQSWDYILTSSLTVLVTLGKSLNPAESYQWFLKCKIRIMILFLRLLQGWHEMFYIHAPSTYIVHTLCIYFTRQSMSILLFLLDQGTGSVKLSCSINGWKSTWGFGWAMDGWDQPPCFWQWVRLHGGLQTKILRTPSLFLIPKSFQLRHFTILGLKEQTAGQGLIWVRTLLMTKTHIKLP